MAEKKQALEGRRINTFGIDPDKLLIVGRDTDDGPEHPLWRKTAKEPADPGKIASIMEMGIIQNVVVVKDKVGRVLVVAGRGRVIAAREAKKRGWEGDVPCVAMRGDEATQLGIAATENAVRRPPDPLELADDAIRLTNMGWEPERIATRLGLKAGRVRDLIKIQELAPSVKKAIKDGEVSVTAAVALDGLTPDEQLSALESLKQGDGEADAPKRATVRQVRQAAAKTAGRAATQALTNRQLRTAYEAIKKLTRHHDGDVVANALGACTALGMALGEKPAEDDPKEIVKAMREAVK
jgi:ParB-like chromosome segregation protein Spo0J